VTRRLRIDDLTTFAVPEQPALSPDGSQIFYVLRTLDADADSTVHTLWRVGARTGEPEQVTRGKSVTVEALHVLIRSLAIPEAEKERLLAMTPASYTGKAAELAKRL